MRAIAGKILSSVLRLFGVRKDETLWVVGGWSGRRYADNSRHFYEYLCHRAHGQRAVWLTRSRAVRRQLRARGLPVAGFYSPRGVWLALRARYLVYCASYDDLSPFCYLAARDAVLVNLWHGSPLKRLQPGGGRTTRTLRRLLLAHLGRECDLLCSASPAMSGALLRYFNVPSERCVVTGYPRNDCLLADSADRRLPPQLDRLLVGRRVITYLPTFRQYRVAGRPVDLLGDFGFHRPSVDRILQRHNAVLLVRAHPGDAPLRARLRGLTTDHIHVLEDHHVDDDVYPLLARTDILVTDYSSVCFDFLLLDRPIVFACFDIARYAGLDRGFSFDYDAMTPGPRTADWPHTVVELDALLSGNDRHAADRRRVRQVANQWCDGNASQRVVAAVLRHAAPAPTAVAATAAHPSTRPADTPAQGADSRHTYA